MHNTVVITDTSCLIAFTKIDFLHILEDIYQKIFITPEIATEFGEELPIWINIVENKDKKYQKVLESFLDLGEASAIALALDYDNVLLVLDDLKARKEAKKIGFTITGTLGIINKAKQLNLITEIKPFIEELKSNGFRIATNIELEILRLNNEL